MAQDMLPLKSCQLRRARRAFSDAAGLPFADPLPAADVDEALRQAGVTSFRRRLFSPAVTLWTFLSQALDSQQNLVQAVARFRAWRRPSYGTPR